MKLIRKDQSIEHENSASCIAVEYPLGDTDINGALIRLNGRYPERGYVMNKACKELVFVVKGSGTLTVDKDTQELHEGDQALILPGEKYYFEGELEMLMPCTPAWYPEQHQEVR